MNTVLGIDTSQYEGKTDLTVAQNNGVRFIVTRCAFGTNYKDLLFEYFWSEAKRVKMIRGTYYFYSYIKSPDDNIKFLKSIFPNGYDGDLPIVIDYEKANSYGNLPTPSAILPALKYFMETISNWSNKKMIFYSNPNTIQHFLSPIPSWLLNYDLWIANYNIVAPDFRPWLNNNVRFWQYTDNGNRDKYGSTDLDYFYGTEEELYKYTNTTKPITVEDRVSRMEQFLKDTLNYHI